MSLLNRLFYLDIDAYIVFKEDVSCVDEKTLLSKGDIWAEKFYMARVDVSNEEECSNLALLWCKAYANCPSVVDAEHIIKRMYINGSICFVAVHEHTCVGMVWLGDNSNFMFSRIGSFLKQEVNKSVYHHIYVTPEARGNNLQSGLRLLALNLVRKRRIDNVYAFVGCKNFSSIKNFLSFSNYYRLIYHIPLDVGPFKLDFHPKLTAEKWTLL